MNKNKYVKYILNTKLELNIYNSKNDKMNTSSKDPLAGGFP